MSAPGFVPGPNNNFQHRSFSPVKDERLPKALKLGGALDLRVS
jgi:hypothetical protein